MISATSTGTELRRFRRGLVPKLALGAMVLIPLLYGALYLWAFWDPTGNLDQLPVALVNSDQGAVVDGDQLDAGHQVTDKLVASKDLDWVVTDAATAEKGVKDGTYYFAVEIPKDFSNKIATASGDDPQAANINVTYNDANSFLATTLGRSAMQQVQGAVRAEVGEQAVDRVLVGLGQARDGFSQASDGALKLTTASGQLTDGADSLVDGTQQADEGATSLATGLTTLQKGVDSAASGVTTLNKGAQKLDSGASTLASGSKTLSQGNADLANGASTLASGTGKLSTGAATLSDSSTKLADGASTLADGAKSAASGAAQVSEGASSASENSDLLAAGAKKVQGAVVTIAPQATQLASGLKQTQTSLESLLTTNIATLTQINSQSPSADMTALITANKQTLASVQTDSSTTFGGLVKGASALAAQFQPSGSTDATAQTLRDGTDQLASGTDALATGLTKLASGASDLNAGTSKVSTGAATLSAGTSKLNAGASTLSTGISKVDTGATKLSKGAATASSGASKVSDGAATLSSGVSSLATGTATLESGAAKLAAGASNAATGATTLSDGTGKLAVGASKLADGSSKVGDGASKLSTALADGAQAIPNDSSAVQTQRATVISAPVTVKDTDIAQAEGFGEGFAPFFISLALFVGSLITWLLLRPMPSRALATPTPGWRLALTGYLPAFLIGIGQVCVMLAVIHYGLGLSMAYTFGTIGFTMLVAATFIALQQMFITVAGPAAGKVIILAFLMIQLASSGGTYPVPTTASFFQALHPWLPMSYAVTGLRQVITGGVDQRLLVAILYLLAVLMGSLALTAWRAGRMRTWSLERLHPAIAI